MNDVRKHIDSIEDRLIVIRHETRFRLTTQGNDTLSELKLSALEVFDVAGRALESLRELNKTLAAQEPPSQAEPSLPANTTIHRHPGFVCSGLCCPKPALHDNLDSKINAIKIVRNTVMSPQGKGYPLLGLKDSKDIIDALDAAGMLRVR